MSTSPARDALLGGVMILLAAACASTANRGTSRGTDEAAHKPSASSSTSTAAATSAVAATNPPGCPATEAATTCDKSMANVLCTHQGNRACRCMPPFSGGAAPEPNAPWTWHCAVAIRPDGCPGLPPVERTPCDAPGRSCSYPGEHANDYFVLTCKDAKWLMTKLPLPTP